MLNGTSNETCRQPYHSTNDLHRTCPSYTHEDDEETKLIRAKSAKVQCLLDTNSNTRNNIESQKGTLPAPIVWRRTSTKQDAQVLSVAHAQNLQCSWAKCRWANKQHVPTIDVDEWSKDFLSLVEPDH